MPAHYLNTHQQELKRAFDHAELSMDGLWLRYFALGGDAGPIEIDAYLNALMPLTPVEHNILAAAINERLDELPAPRASYLDPRS